MKPARGIVFKAKDGNRFLVPGLYWPADDPVPEERLWSAFEFEIVAGVSREPDYIEFDADNFDNIPTFVPSSSFAHGGFDVILIGGPAFDKAFATPEPPAALAETFNTAWKAKFDLRETT